MEHQIHEDANGLRTVTLDEPTLGTVVELRELPVVAMREMLQSTDTEGIAARDRGFYMTAASLFIDGRCYSMAELNQFPGRKFGAIMRCVSACMKLYDLVTEDDKATEGAEGEQKNA